MKARNFIERIRDINKANERQTRLHTHIKNVFASHHNLNPQNVWIETMPYGGGLRVHALLDGPDLKKIIASWEDPEG